MAERTGWLLDLYEDPLGGVVLWLLADDGARLRLRQRFPVTFYAAGPPARLEALAQFLRAQFLGKDPAELSLRHEEREDVFAGYDVPVLAVEVQRPADLPGLFQRASRAFTDLTFADADLQLSLRYAASQKVGPLGRCRVTLDGAGFVRKMDALDTPWDLDPLDPPLRVLTLEPDCDPAHAVPRAVRAQWAGQERSFRLSPARPLLVNLRALLADYDPDLLLTSWGDTWLLPRLIELSEEYNLPLPLNRDPDAGITRRKERWYFSYGQIIYRGEQVHLFGRWHVDRKNAMLWSDYDLDGVLEMTRVTGLPLQTAARVSPGTGISSIQMRTALEEEILVPWQKQQAEIPKPAADLYASDQGGLVFQPRVGVHRDVAEVDFISMYPAIMVYCNISPETINQTGPGAEPVPGLGFSIDHSRKGLVPRALHPLLDKRVALKLRQASLPAWDERRGRDKRRASALKWLLVTCFGYLGYKNARFGRIEAHQAVTAYGREALLRAKETAEDLGFEVIQLYVDGMWAKQAGRSRPEDFQDLLVQISERSGLPIALDGVYRWVVFLASRQNPNRPVANRYFGVFQSGEIKTRGIAARRHDTPPFIARVQAELIEILAAAGEPEEALLEASAHLSRRLAELRRGRVPLEQLLLSQRITREVEEYRSPSPAGRAARQLKDAGKIVKPGQKVRFLFTLGNPGVFAWDLPERPNPATADLPRYRTLLLRAAKEVLEPFGWKDNAAISLPGVSPPELEEEEICEPGQIPVILPALCDNRA
jgi:DNA polymerase II